MIKYVSSSPRDTRDGFGSTMEAQVNYDWSNGLFDSVGSNEPLCKLSSTKFDHFRSILPWGQVQIINCIP